MIKTNQDLQFKKAHSITSAAAQIDASVPFIRKLVRNGDLRAKKIGSRVVILESDLHQFLDKQPDWKVKKVEETK